MGLTVSDLLPDYTASLNDAAAVFGSGSTTPTLDANLTRHLNVAARAVSADGKRPLLKLASIAVSADVSSYGPVPDDFIVSRATQWPAPGALRAWQQPPGVIPRVFAAMTDAGQTLMLTPPPSQDQINVYGVTLQYIYLAAHAITDDETTSTLTDVDRNLVILRAQVEAMREMTFRNIHKPVSMRAASAGASTSNMQPSALYERLLAEYKDAA